MTDFPVIAGIDPLEYLRLVKRLNDYLLTQGKISWKFWLDIWNGREDVKELEGLFQSEWGRLSRKWPELRGLWSQCGNLERTYLMGRACDLARFGEGIANQTFPPPVLTGSETIVSALVWLMQEKQTRLLEEEEKEEFKKELEYWERTRADKIAKISNAPPEHLEPRVLTGDEISLVKEACLRELEQGGWNVKGTLAVIEDFVKFCQLLSRPENHTLIQSGQYVWKAVNTRSYADMEVEMAWELTNLPNRVAYAKVTREQEGRQVVLKRQIQTLELPAVRMDRARLEWTITHRSYSLYYQERRKIEEDISQKERKRLGLSLAAPPPPAATQHQEPAAPPPGDTVVTETQGELSRPAVQLPEQDAPPPASLATRTAEGTPLKREDKTEETPIEESKLNKEAENVRQEETAALKAVTNRPVPTIKDAWPKDEAAEAQTVNPPEAQLLYQSNFYLPDDKWLEGELWDGSIRSFRQGGYYHMVLSLSEWWVYRFPRIPLASFRVHVDAEFMTPSGSSASCGVVFRVNNDHDKYSFYCFTILRSGNYGLFFRVNKHWETILDFRPSEFIRRGDSTNSLLVEMTGQKITLGINGHCLATLLDNRLAGGYVGLFAGTGSNDSFVEARFRDFRLYAP